MILYYELLIGKFNYDFQSQPAELKEQQIHLLIILEMLQLMIQVGLTLIILRDCLLAYKMYWQMA